MVGFATLTVKKKAARWITNPMTGITYRSHAKKQIASRQSIYVAKRMFSEGI
jgi:nucleoid DNA-binding protein